MKGIIVAGGEGERLSPMTSYINKHLLPVYDRPMIDCPLQSAQALGITEVLITAHAQQLPVYQNLLGDGADWQLKLSYLERPRGDGVANVLPAALDFIGQDSVCLLLGDNYFAPEHLASIAAHIEHSPKALTLVTTSMSDSSEYGVLVMKDGQPQQFIEKPQHAVSNCVVTGMYFFKQPDLQQYLKQLPGKFELPQLIQMYIEQQQAQIIALPDNAAWFDMGTPERLYQASRYVRSVRRAESVTAHGIQLPVTPKIS